MMSLVETPVVILAGGLATRLHPISRTIPKAMVSVAGRPFIDHQLELLAGQGIQRVVLCVGHLSEQIEEHVGDGRAYGLEVRYSHDGPIRLGTGGALRRALPMIGEACFVLYGDSYLTVSFAEVYETFRRSGKLGVMTVYRNRNQFDRSNILFEEGRIVRYSKAELLPTMEHIDYGLSVLAGEVIGRIPEGTASDLSAILTEMVVQGEVAGHEVLERFHEIGSHEGLAEAEVFLSRAA